MVAKYGAFLHTMKLNSQLREGRYVPFGPFLAGSGLAVLLIGAPQILDWLGWA